MMARLRGLQLFVLWLAACGAGLLLISLPRAIAPLELPALVLLPDEVRAQQQRDATLATSALGTERAKSFWDAYLQFGETEVITIDRPHAREQRQRALKQAVDLVEAESGPEAVEALRAYAVERFEAALRGELPASEQKAVLGVFAYVLAQFQVTYDGLEVAPHFVTRTLYKARWNRMCGQPPEDGLSPVEKRAYFGWMGLGAGNLPILERRQALLGYAAAGGAHADQALGVLAFMDHDYARAASSLERAYDKHASLRLRNYLRGALVAAGQAGDAAHASATHEPW